MTDGANHVSVPGQVPERLYTLPVLAAERERELGGYSLLWRQRNRPYELHDDQASDSDSSD